MVRVGIVGISGYSGALILERLLKHPQVRVTYASANNTKGKMDAIWPKLKGRTDLVCDKYDSKKAIDLCDVVFLAVPHTVAMQIVPELLLAKKRVIDISADYRLKDINLFKEYYGVDHKDKANLKKAVYGLPELYREEIKKAVLVANPGCYPTAAILALAPLVATKAKTIQSITIDAKSGVSGAGRKATLSFMYCEVNENLKAYKVLKHQHTPEIDQYLSALAQSEVSVDFVPHLIPMNHGILETIYVRFTKGTNLKNLFDLYKKFYKQEKFIRLLEEGVQPEIKNVVGTNYCDLGFVIEESKKLVVITSALDNLMKGASGQAVQNMNIMCGFNEELGIV